MSILLMMWIIVVLAISTVHIRQDSGTVARIFCTLMLLLLAAFTIFICGSHKCDEGDAPASIMLATAALTACLPWMLRLHPWLMRAAVAVVIYAGATIASDLTHSYHRDDMTGNPRYASGRFWHTPLTGQYPRAPAYTLKARLEKQYEDPKTNMTNSLPEGGVERR